MEKKKKQKKQGFDERFDSGEEDIDFSKALRTEGLSKVVKLPPISIPVWLAAEIESISQLQTRPSSHPTLNWEII